MPEDFFQIRLPGCTPEPLANYLKALGVFRILVESGEDRHCLAYWENEQFVLLTQLREDQIVDFFLHRYQPSPIVSPWNGSTGFYPGNKTQKVLLDAILDGSQERFEPYQMALQIPFAVIAALGLTKQPEKEDKPLMIRRLRDMMPNVTAEWIDACGMITSGGDFKTIPLLGTGGNDGNLEFGRAFMQHLQNVIDCKTGKPTVDSEKSLRSALLDQVSPQNFYSGPIGQFSPIAAGGANATTGTDADSQVNPWDFILMLEGALVFMPGITRRGETGSGTIAAPFTATRPSKAGYGSAAEEKIRAELWLPLWDQPVTLGELRVTFREGRAKVNIAGGRGKVRYRTAQSGVDFARAVGHLGVARGLKSFQRYGFQERNGLSYFAVSLGRYHTPPRPRRDPLEDLDQWLLDFSRFASGDKTPESIKRANRSLERTIVELAQGKASYLDLLMALGDVEHALNQSFSYVMDSRLKPIPYLRSSRWVRDAYDSSAGFRSEFRLALALANSGLRQRLVRVRGQTAYWQKEDDHITTWRFGSLEDNLLNLAMRREIEQEQDEKAAARLSLAVQETSDTDEEIPKAGTLQSNTPKSNPPQSKPLNLLPNHADIDAWIRDELDDDRLEAIARGLSLLSFTRSLEPFAAEENGLSVAYKILKVAQQRPVIGQSQAERLPRTRGLINKLQAGRLQEALSDALRRLRSSNQRPRFDPDRSEAWSAGLDPKRLGAALAFPLTEEQVQVLLKEITVIEN
jgi:CRISPR-associated protein Csx17